MSSSDPSTPGQIAAALRDHPIVVSPMMGGGDTAATLRVLTELRTHSTVPVYVALVRTPTGADYGGDALDLDKQLVSLVHARLDRPGVYYVHTSQGYGDVGVYGVYADPGSELATDYLDSGVGAGADQISAALPHTAALGSDPEVSPGGDAAVLLDLTAQQHLKDPFDSSDPGATVPVLSQAQVTALTGAPWVEPGYVETSSDALAPPSVGLTTLCAVAVGLAVLLISFRAMRAVSALRLVRFAGSTATARGAKGERNRARSGHSSAGSRTEPEPDLEGLRASARRALRTLDRELAGRAAERADPVVLARAGGSREAASGLLDSSDVLDLVGAQVLALGGSRALREPGGAAYTPCFIDPLHGEGVETSGVGAAVDVPTCQRCHDAIREGRTPHPLLDRRGKAYYRGRTVWARTGFGATDDDLWRQVLDPRR